MVDMLCRSWLLSKQKEQGEKCARLSAFYPFLHGWFCFCSNWRGICMALEQSLRLIGLKNVHLNNEGP